MRFQPGEIEGVQVREVSLHTDERGWLAEIFRSDQMEPKDTPAMGYISVTLPGAARGPHEHREQTDRFCFLGPGRFELRLWDNRDRSATYHNSKTLIVGDGKPSIVVIPPGVVHGYRNVGQVDGLVINLPDRLYKGEGWRGPLDEIRHEADPGNPFRMG